MNNRFYIIITILFLCCCKCVVAQELCFVELNCENLFDTNHDEGKDDYEYCENGEKKWNLKKYWNKQRQMAKELISCGGEKEEWVMPDMIALVEVENDTVMRDLTKRTPLKTAGYEYIMTNSEDVRGVDVALIYRKSMIQVLATDYIRPDLVSGQKRTRDVLYAKVKWYNQHVFHVFVVHSPSRSGGKKETEKYRMRIAETLCRHIDSLKIESPDAQIIVAGDFNDYSGDASMQYILKHDMNDVSSCAEGGNGAKGTYRYKGEWGSLDHIFISEALYKNRLSIQCYINDKSFLTENEPIYGGVRPRRTYTGPKYDSGGFSDHLPLVLKIKF